MKKIALVLIILGISIFAYTRFTKKPNVIIIMIDTLRADHFSYRGYERETTPFMDSLAKNFLDFRKAFAVAPWTPPSVASIMTGLYPSGHGHLPHQSRNVALNRGSVLSTDLSLISELLQDSGYQTGIVSSNPWITKEFGFDQGYDEFHYFYKAKAEVILKKSRELISSWDKGEPFFLFTLLFDPHNPYEPPAPYDTMFKGDLKNRTYTPELNNVIRAYDGEIRYTDDQLKLFFEYLKENNLYKNTDIYIVSDHGEQFRERGSLGHGKMLHQEETLVPLIIKLDNKNEVIEYAVSHIDIVPTILERTRITPPTKLQGISLLDKDALSKRLGVYSEVYRTFNQRAFSVSDGHRLITDLQNPFEESESYFTRGLFDRVKDPLEFSPLTDPALENELYDYLKSAAKNSTIKREVDSVEIPEETMKKLETLGYIN